MPDRAAGEFESRGLLPGLSQKRNDLSADVSGDDPIPLGNCEAGRENSACSVDQRSHRDRSARLPDEGLNVAALAACDTRFCVLFSSP